MTTLLIATRNAHKAREIQQVLAADYQYLTLNDFPGSPAVVEDGATFAANAAKKASTLADWLATTPQVGRALRARRRDQPESTPSTTPPNTPFYILSDDSGLEVDALGGAPGVHSARFAALDTGAAENSSDNANNTKLLRLLENIPAARRTARFRCVLALRKLGAPSSAEIAFFEGVCPGRIALQPSGGGGFGYDPLFIPEGHTQSFAELGEAAKNSLSHRALALQKLRQFLTRPALTP